MSILDYNFGIEFNPETHILGDLCRKEHRYQGLDFSLRLKKTNQCCFCKREYRQKKDETVHPERVARKKEFHQKEDKPVSAKRFPFNPQSHQLGNLCKERHNYDSTGKTLRKKTKNGLGGNCIACEREQYQAKADLRIAEQHKTQPYVKDCKCGSCQAELKRRVDQRLIAQKITTKAWLERNPDYHKDWQKTGKGLEYRREKDKLRHARKRKPGGSRYSPVEWQERKALFDNQCVYCGSSNHITLEHVIPLCDDRGFDRITNIVPACWECNCKSKRDKRMADWYPQQPFFTIQRFEKLMSALGEAEIDAVLSDLDL